MTWNWEQKDWPNFTYNKEALKEFEEQFIKSSGGYLGAFKHITDNDREVLKIELISEEAFKTSKIEGELLDRDSLQSSICRQFGLKTDKRKVKPAEQGISQMMVELYKSFNTPLSHQYLYNWHKLLMSGQESLDIGIYRQSEDPMQVISGLIYEPTVHFQAPPAHKLHREMTGFINWFNASSKNGINPLPSLTRAGIAHLYFVSIHPFEDGNGRLARALSEKSLAQNLNRPSLAALSYTIEHHRKDYYKNLELNNKHNEITNWLIYFAQTVLEAQKNTEKRLDFIIEKTKLYDRLKNSLNPRQEKVLKRMFREGVDGFKGGLSAHNYMKITKTPSATATRDLKNLVEKGAFIKIGKLRHTRYYLNFKSLLPLNKE